MEARAVETLEHQIQRIRSGQNNRSPLANKSSYLKKIHICDELRLIRHWYGQGQSRGTGGILTSVIHRFLGARVHLGRCFFFPRRCCRALARVPGVRSLQGLRFRAGFGGVIRSRPDLIDNILEPTP